VTPFFISFKMLLHFLTDLLLPMSSKSDTDQKDSMKPITIFMVLLAACVIALWLYAVGSKWRENLETLFSGLAFIGVVWAILIQKQELEEQRNELILTRGVFKEQNSTSRKQRFENTFFELLSVFIEKGKSFESNLHGRVKTGQAGFVQVADELKGKIRTSQPKETEAAQLLREFMKIRGNSELVGYFQYIKNLILTIDYIRDSPLIEETEREFYFNVFKSQISGAELLLFSLEVQKTDSDLKGTWVYDELARIKFFAGIGEYKYEPPVSPVAHFFKSTILEKRPDLNI
jgi:hypothetical protein